MKKLLILIVLFGVGCGGGNNADPKKAIEEGDKAIEQAKKVVADIKKQDVNRVHEKLIQEFSLDANQIKELREADRLSLSGLAAMTDEQA